MRSRFFCGVDKSVVAVLSFCVVMTAGMFGCSSTNLAGTGTETSTKGTVAGIIVDQDGIAAPRTLIALVPVAYDPAANGPSPAMLTDTSSSDGSYSFTRVDSGDYNIQAVHLDTRARALVRGISVERDSITAPVDTLRKPGTIKIVLPDSINATNGYVFVPGTTVYSLLRGTNGSVTLDSVPAGSGLSVCYAVNGSPAKPLIFRDSVFVAPGSVTTVTNVAWNFQKKLYLNTTVSGANVPGIVANFPVLVRLNAGNFDFSQAHNSGNDIRFTKANGEPLPYEIDSWDSAGGLAEVWVKVDTVYGNDSTHFVNMYWGNPNAASGSNGAAAFDTASGFGGVWHMGPAVNNIIADATINHYDGTLSDTAPIPATGTIGMGNQFDGIDNSITLKGTANSALNFPENGYYTLCAWVYADTLDYAPATDSVYANDMTIISKDNCQYALKTRTTNWSFDEFHNYSGWQATFAPATQRVWKYVAGVRQGTQQFLYVDGKCVVDSVSAFSPKNEPRTTIADVTIGKMPGKRWASLTSDGPGCFFNGTIDEVRIMTKATSVDYIKLCFMNQKSPDALVVFR
jgi:hypothetical protein